MRATCQPNVTEIGDWFRPYESYGSKRQTLIAALIALCHQNPYNSISKMIGKKIISFDIFILYLQIVPDCSGFLSTKSFQQTKPFYISLVAN